MNGMTFPGIMIILMVWISVGSSSRALYNRPKFCSAPEWSLSGEVLWSSEYCTKSDLLDVFVDVNDAVYICCCQNTLIASSCVWIIGCSLRWVHTYKGEPKSLFVIPNDGTVTNQDSEKTIQLWSPWTRDRSVVSVSSCYGLFVDSNHTLYCSIKGRHKILKISLKTKMNSWTTAAGQDSPGKGSDKLNEPRGIFVNTNFNLYVADCKNNRIQRFTSERFIGETVINSALEIDSKTLRCPTDITLDADDNMYVVDSGNDRIVLVPANGKNSRCIVGCSPEGGGSTTRVKEPRSMSFDRFGNIFVTETKKKRALKFTLQTANCVNSSTEIESVTWGPPLAEVSIDYGNYSNSSSEDYGEMDSSELTDLETTASLESSVSLSASTTTSTLSSSSSPISIIEQPIVPFIAPSCPNASVIGFFCNISFQPCDIHPYCRNAGTCENNPNATRGYICKCQPGYVGTNCEIATHPCQWNICLHNGQCVNVSESKFVCKCTEGRTGVHCERLVDYCHNVTCLNRGVCQPLLLDYKCVCISASFSGRHCEHAATTIVVYQYVSKSLGYIAILAVSMVFAFVVIMDILKYGFGIDPVRGERERLRRERFQRRRNHWQGRTSQNQRYVRRMI